MRENIARANGNTWERDAPWDFVKDGGFYNELVINFDAFHAALPEAIEAIFYIDGGCNDRRPQPWVPGGTYEAARRCEDYARWAHAELQAAWPLRARNIPLVKMNVWSFESPFEWG